MRMVAPSQGVASVMNIWDIRPSAARVPCAAVAIMLNAAQTVKFVGQTAFGPHPDPPRLEGALQHLQELRVRFNASTRASATAPA